MSRTQHYGGERYIWSLAQTAKAAARFAHFPPTVEGLEALQAAVALAKYTIPADGPRDMAWARVAFADAERRLNFKYEKVPA